LSALLSRIVYFLFFFFVIRPPPPISTLFPYTTLFRSNWYFKFLDYKYIRMVLYDSCYHHNSILNFLNISPIGKLILGKPHDEPEFKIISWLAMLFSAGMDIGLVFYGVSEPISHYLMPTTTEPETKEAFMESMRSTIFHYGFHPWAVYGIVALSLAYFQFRKNEDGLLSKTLRPIFGDRVDGPLG